MSIAVFITNRQDAKSAIPWAASFAYAKQKTLFVIVPKKSKGKETWRAIDPQAGGEEKSLLNSVMAAVHELDQQKFTWISEEDERPENRSAILIREIISPNPQQMFTEEIMDLDIRLLVIPAHEPTKLDDQEEHWIQKLWLEAPCETMLIRGKVPQDQKAIKITVATDGEPDTDIALSLAKLSAEKNGGDMSMLYVRPDDDAYAMQVARYQMERLDKNVRVDLAEIPKTIVLQKSLRNAIQSHCGKHQPDLVIVGTRNLRKTEALLRPWENTDHSSAVAIIRGGVPFSNRLLNELRLWTRSRVPQMNREQRVKLVDRLNVNSNFDFDFVALIVLSTMIAALGLIQNSGAVVIGAMLVAPLMTPLVGIGFSLVQGNEQLLRVSLKSVVLGFVVAFGIGIIVGLLVSFGHWIGLLQAGINPGNTELQARGHPALLDWFIAFVSGVAAAYAMSRPNLLSALPGVAIAAALVPPIATSGLATSLFEFWLAGGSFVLFFTNIVAIVLGTAITFWAVGVDSRPVAKKKEGKDPISWPRNWFAAFVLLSILIVTGMSTMYRPDTTVIPNKNLEPMQ
ncbi:MAG: DUF389 domain-containing protein, partial [Planctomycetota bacterium]